MVRKVFTPFHLLIPFDRVSDYQIVIKTSKVEVNFTRTAFAPHQSTFVRGVHRPSVLRINVYERWPVVAVSITVVAGNITE